MKRFVALAVLTLLVGSKAQSTAGSITFGFEALSATSASLGHPGALTTLSLSKGGESITITRPGSTFDIVDATSFGTGTFPAAFGTRSLDPFSAETSNTSFVVNFSVPVSSVSLSFGDFGADSDIFTMNAYSGASGTGTLLGTATDNYGTQSFPNQYDTSSISASGINSIVFIGGSPNFPNSLYYDNLTLNIPSTAVPEPASLTLASLGALGLLLGRRRAKRVA